MALTAFPNGLSSFGIPLLGNGLIPSNIGTYRFVNPSTGSDNNPGTDPSLPLRTIQEAVDQSSANDVILLAPGAYDESVTIDRDTGPLSIVGLGNRGDAYIEPSTAGAEGLINNSDDVTLINVGIAGDGTGSYAMRNTGSRLRLNGCKLEGTDTSGDCLQLAPGTVAQEAAGTAGTCGDIIVTDCEFAWSYNGINLVASDYGTPTQVVIQDCKFHNISNIELLGTPGAFGIGSVRNLEFVGNLLDAAEDGTAPSDFIKVDDASDTGIIAQNMIRIATNASADLKIGAAILWVANMTEAGISTARPA